MDKDKIRFMVYRLPDINNRNYHAALEKFQSRLNSTQGRLALGVQIGGSGTKLLIRTADGQTLETELGLKDKFDKSKTPIDKQNEVREMFIAIMHAKQMFIDVASTLEQEVIPMVDSICGFPLTKTQVNPESPDAEIIKGEHYLRNLDHGQTILSGITNAEINTMPAGTTDNPSSHNRIYNFEALSRHAAQANPKLNFDFSYSDDTKNTTTINSSIKPNPGNKVQIQSTTTNDTVLVARSIADKIQTGENTVGIVVGSGFNIGYCENYQGNGKFAEIRNTEIGGSNNTSDVFLSLSDEPFLNEARSLNDANLEKLLACSESGKEGLEARFEHLTAIVNSNNNDAISSATKTINFYLDKAYSNDQGITIGSIKTEMPKIKAEIQKTGSYRNTFLHILKNGSPDAQLIVKALFVMQINAITKVLSSKNMFPLISNPKTTKIAITGSWGGILIGALDKGAEIFATLLNDKLKAKTGYTRSQYTAGDITLYGKNDYDGMVHMLDNALIQAKAAMARNT